MKDCKERRDKLLLYCLKFSGWWRHFPGIWRKVISSKDQSTLPISPPVLFQVLRTCTVFNRKHRVFFLPRWHSSSLESRYPWWKPWVVGITITWCDLLRWEWTCYVEGNLVFLSLYMLLPQGGTYHWRYCLFFCFFFCFCFRLEALWSQVLSVLLYLSFQYLHIVGVQQALVESMDDWREGMQIS